MTAGTPNWLQSGQGSLPPQAWSFAADARLADVRLARETGDVLLSDESGGMYLIDRRGRVQALTRTSHDVRPVALADDGSAGAAVLDGTTLAWFDRQLQFRWTRPLPDEAVGLAITSHGTHVLASLANGRNVIYDADKRLLVEFESLRPLRFVQFLTCEPAIIAAADYGFFARYSLDGDPEWTERLWSTVADLAVTGDGNAIALAGLAHGIQIYDGEGSSKGSFVLDGTAHLVSSTFVKKRWAAATLEKQLMLLDSDGDLRWMVTAPDDIARLQLSPLGDWLLVGFATGRVVRLDCA
uniref:WD40 repeat domain-containing protein n=1 Tax=Schlesneria paludicola TaxID=360056 RepID=A0A7C2P101_9PLAN